jgi:hypothetical protein
MNDGKVNIDIKAIIDFLDNYLERSKRQSIDPVEANELLAKARLLPNSQDRPGKTLRDLLRKGHLQHAFQAGGKGSAWTIPHSNRKSSKTIMTRSIVTKVEKPRLVSKVSEVSTMDNSQHEKLLMIEHNFKSASSIDNLVPHKSGLYCIRIRDIHKLPKPFNTMLADRKHDIVYIGIATGSLNKRFLNQELRANGHGTFFRSIGAVLGHRPPKGSLVTKKNKRNYKFSPSDERKIVSWINDNLVVSWIEYSGDFESFENDLITKYKPLINLAKNPLALRELSELRKICVQIANEE